MNRFRNYILVFCLFMLACIISPTKTNAQPADPGCDPLDPACPIDGGIGLLIAAGIAIGARKAYHMKKSTADLHCNSSI